MPATKFRVWISIFACLLAVAPAVAQDQADWGPFTSQEAELMSAVWPEIREAQSFDRIDWESVGLARAPGSFEARQLMEMHWGGLRQAAQFSDIDWEATTGHPVSRDVLAQQHQLFDRGPFTAREAALMNAVWPQIRTAASFQEINWEAAGLEGPPGNREARRIMERHWGSLREAEQFGHIDWEATTDFRG